VALADTSLPAYLDVQWTEGQESLKATWTLNVEDRSALPPPAELRDLPVDVLLAALASSRPLPIALEHELRRRERASSNHLRVELDPLQRFDDSGLLLQRTRHLSLALWRLQDRLGRPASSMDALHWRLHGPFGPLTIAEGLVGAAHAEEALPGEAHFLLAELALTITAVDWSQLSHDIDAELVREMVLRVLAALEVQVRALPPAPDAALHRYVEDAIAKARQ
jgi:hypothetical protein